MKEREEDLNKMIEDAWAYATTTEKREQGSFSEFFVLKNESAEVVVLSKTPYVFYGHSVKISTKNGGFRYITMTCQKMTKEECILCNMDNPVVGNRRRFIAFEVLDLRGKYEEGSFNGEPMVKVWLPPDYLVQQLNELRKSVGGDLTKYALTVKRLDKNMVVSISTLKLDDNRFAYTRIEDLGIDFEALERVDLEKVLQPKTDEYIKKTVKDSGGQGSSVLKVIDTEKYIEDDGLPF